jgi:thiosulfate/3-mercaptopyruvate sulfurtransferase
MGATRQFFSLLYYGFPAKDLFILDGGLFKWQKEGLPVTKDITLAPKKGSFKIKKLNEDVKVKLPEFLTASGDPVNNVLLEALGANWHFGEVLAFTRAGHIPNGILLPSADFYNPDKTFKSAEEIRRMLAYLGIRPEQQIYTYCGGGVAASVPFFALKFILNYPKVRLYTESEMGWLSDERELPYWTYDAPSLMRETNWLKFWSSQMIRTFVSTRVSIVDVRPAGAFNQGHVPFALNIPADVFKSNITNPDKLAEILGPAGVNASHEAVVISGAGLTTDSALAFVMLEKLGQKKVSVFMDSLDKCAQLGFAVTKDATVVGPKKAPRDVSIPPTTYPGNFRKGVIIADPKSTQGLYPKVFIASGKNVPAKAQDGKVVHVPYTDLLNADGTPKAAKDIWNILAKAGVPRYAELVCFSDDPGEAAANYFILKLMGYPDIKVLVI